MEEQTATATTTKTMTAAYQAGYGKAGDVVGVREMPIPTIKPDQVLIQVKASSINALDWHFLSGTPYFLRLQNGFRTSKRTVPGADVSGTIVELGDDVTGFEIGDQVFGQIGQGGFAAYAAARASALAKAPQNLPLAESATLGVAALTALQSLRDWAMMRPGDRVLVNGGSGGVGSFAIQIAQALGASHVTAVCSTPNVEMAVSLGADRVVDYTTDDFTTVNDRFDIVLDNAGSRSLTKSRRLLKENGTLVMVTGKKGTWIRPADRMLAGAIRSKFWTQRFVSRTAVASGEDGAALARMVEDGQVRPVIDRRFTLAESVEALEYQSTGHARGKSIVVVS